MRQSRRWSSPANHPVQTRIGRSQALPRCVSAPRQDRTINWLKVLNSFADSLAGGVPIGADRDPTKYGDSYRSIKEIARNPAGIPVRCRFRSSHEAPRLEESGFEPSVPLGEKRSFRNARIRELHRAAYRGGRKRYRRGRPSGGRRSDHSNTATASELQVRPVG